MIYVDGLFVGVGGMNILTTYRDPILGPTFVGCAVFMACVGLGGFHSLRKVAASVDTGAVDFERGHLQQLGAGCYFVQRPYVCSKPAAPAIANGGDMFGCADGHWVMGVAHHSDELPPPLVSASSNICLRTN